MNKPINQLEGEAFYTSNFIRIIYESSLKSDKKISELEDKLAKSEQEIKKLREAVTASIVPPPPGPGIAVTKSVPVSTPAPPMRYFFNESGSLNIPDDIKTLIITAAAAGGAGGHGVLENEDAVGGPGGGAGAGILFYPIRVGKAKTIAFTIGKGGVEPSQDGGDTVVKYDETVLTLGGGKGSKDVHDASGGAGGTCDIDARCSGFSGSSGSEAIVDRKSKDANVAVGGDGGNSLFAKGGTGGLKAYVKGGDGRMAPSIKGLDAEGYAAGGGGSGVGIAKNLVGKGGDGFVFVQFA